MDIHIPSLSYQLNTMVRKHREAKGYSQEEFAFLIGRPLEEVRQNEDLTSHSSYDINYTNFYARVLDRTPKDMFLKFNISTPTIKISAVKSIEGNTINYKGTAICDGQTIKLESYNQPISVRYENTEGDQDQVLELLDEMLKNGYFKTGVTGYALYSEILEKHSTGIIELPKSFRPILVARALTIMSNRRKKPKLLPQRQLPKTDEKWLLYKEDL